MGVRNQVDPCWEVDGRTSWDSFHRRDHVRPYWGAFHGGDEAGILLEGRWDHAVAYYWDSDWNHVYARDHRTAFRLEVLRDDAR